MNIEVIVLNKNHYAMDNGSKGANLTIFGEMVDTDFGAGVSISETPIPYEEHANITVFPAKYSAKGSMRGVKNRGGKTITSLHLNDLKLISKVEFKDVIAGK